MGDDLPSLVLRGKDGSGFFCRSQCPSARTHTEPVEWARDVVAACPTVTLPLGEDSMLLASEARVETDWAAAT